MLAGHADAHRWFSSGILCTLRVCNHELNMVWEDYQRVKEDFSKAAVTSVAELLHKEMTINLFVHFLVWQESMKRGSGNDKTEGYAKANRFHRFIEINML